MTIEAPARAFLQPAAKKDVTVIQAEMVSTTLPKAVSLDDNGAKRDHSIYKMKDQNGDYLYAICVTSTTGSKKSPQHFRTGEAVTVVVHNQISAPLLDRLTLQGQIPVYYAKVLPRVSQDLVVSAIHAATASSVTAPHFEMDATTLERHIQNNGNYGHGVLHLRKTGQKGAQVSARRAQVKALLRAAPKA
jgi:hypothetical protein